MFKFKIRDIGNLNYDYKNLTPLDFKNKFIDKKQCVFIKDGMNEWPALNLWQNPYYLTNLLGNKKLDVEVYPREGYKITDAVKEKMTYEEYINKLENNGKEFNYYLAEVDIIANAGKQPSVMDELAKDILIPKYVNWPKHDKTVVFIGKDSISECHYHTNTHAILCQLVGKKRILLFSPHQGQFYNLYPKPWYKKFSNWSQVDFSKLDFSPNLTKFNKLLNATAYEFILEPGDMLFIPIYWWHAAFSFGHSISVTHFWKANFADCYLNWLGARSLNHITKLR